MEETLFENTITCTQLVWKELYMKQAKLRLLRTMIVDAIALIILFMYTVMSHNIIYTVTLIAIFTVLNLIEFFLLPARQAKMAYKRAMELYHSEQTYQTYLYQDHILLKNLQNKGELDIPYNKISALLDTKHTYLLKLKQKQFLVIQKDGFTKGTMLDFVNFLESKNIPRKF